MKKLKLVILTGAGMSAESGIKTFRDSDGTWENHDPKDVATPGAWKKDPEMVLRFYNERRKQLEGVEPNEGHKLLVQLEDEFDVQIITQNIDNLHERAGSTSVLHLHGELTKARGVMYNHKSSPLDEIHEIGYEDINIGDLCEVNKSQLRPHIVWFGEDVPKINEAAEITLEADILVVIGTSMSVYPAASLHELTPEGTPKFMIDPSKDLKDFPGVTHIKEIASVGIKELIDKLMKTN